MSHVNINGSARGFNEGFIKGSVFVNSYKGEFTNSGTIQANNGAYAVGGMGYMYNQGELYNYSDAVDGGVNYLMYLNRPMDKWASVVNSGTISATGGYGAILAEDTQSHWLYNTASGNIQGENMKEALVKLNGRNSFHNDGVITVKGDNAVGILAGSNSTVINSGTLNVGTEEGRKDGSNGTGLVGIKGTGNTVVNNTASGVINVWADKSSAFGGTMKQLINN
ncbi:TPA: autotransporter adhesin BigA, partial [Escherichia coli]|nr:autotransporter adhesin BigA [Escherichia coli]HEC5176970.1 autotransporter adhesin BigA [Escherichia coli]